MPRHQRSASASLHGRGGACVSSDATLGHCGLPRRAAAPAPHLYSFLYCRAAPHLYSCTAPTCTASCRAAPSAGAPDRPSCRPRLQSDPRGGEEWACCARQAWRARPVLCCRSLGHKHHAVHCTRVPTKQICSRGGGGALTVLLHKVDGLDATAAAPAAHRAVQAAALPAAAHQLDNVPAVQAAGKLLLGRACVGPAQRRRLRHQPCSAASRHQSLPGAGRGAA